MLYRSNKNSYKSIQESYYEDMVANKPIKKVIEKGVNFPDSETYVEKLMIVYFIGETKPLEIYYSNYTEVYKKCVSLGITNKNYFNFMARLSSLCTIKKVGQLEKLTFINVTLDVKDCNAVPKLPKGI